jgi:hypothetical protein
VGRVTERREVEIPQKAKSPCLQGLSQTPNPN